MNLSRAAVLVFCLVLSLPACARDCEPQFEGGWIRLTPVKTMMAGFGRIENPCPQAVTIVGVSSPAFGDVSLHETRVVDGVSRMRALPELRVPAGGSAELKPGGLHLMLMQPRQSAEAGRKVEVMFALKEGGTLRGELEVRKPAE